MVGETGQDVFKSSRGNDIRPGERFYPQGAGYGEGWHHPGRSRPLHGDRRGGTQFELLLRQKDIIGDWGGPNGEKWAGYFTWENIPGWRWRMKTSKSKYRAAAEFDLTSYSMLFPLLEAVPHDERVGAIIKGEHGLPVRERSYRKWFRQIARAADIPDTVWSMDSRAGGATEAEEAGAALDAIQGALTHSKKDTTLRYIRRNTAKIATVAEARNRKRATDEKGA
jgi:hypothetical protein